MLNKIKGGSQVKIQGLTINIPPIGMGVDCVTQELKPVEILKRSSKKEEQYWEAHALPEDWEERLEQEKLEAQRLKNAGLDDNYTDVELDKIREREWNRRIYGVWFMNNGTPVYLTGTYYFYLTYWQLDTGLPDFRIIDWEYFMFWAYISYDPKCYGMIEICKRRNGKTARAACIIYEIISRTKRALGGMQSMNEQAAKDIFDLAVIPAFQQLPEFFIPTYDTSKGSTPKGELVFTQTSVKGKKALLNLKTEQLNSRINYKDAKPKAYDGKKTKLLILDESGKVEHDVVERHLIVKKCCVDNRRNIIGKMIVTSTVEEMGIKFRFKTLWEWSDQENREADGQTKSGLYRFFVPADRSGGYNKYGYPYENDTRQAILTEREKLKNNPRDLFNEIRKEPLTIEEAFKVSNDECHFNQILLEDIHSTLTWSGKENYEQGNIEYIDGIPYNQDSFKGVHWVKSKQGRWFKRKDFEQPQNAYTKRSNTFYPNNKVRFASACDPFQLDVTEDSRNSKLASHVKQRFAPEGQGSPLNKAYVLRYYARPKLVAMSHEDMIKQCLFTGGDILIENAKDGGMIKTFENNGMGAFLQKLPSKENFGVYPDENNKVLGLGLLNDFYEKEVSEDHYKILHEQDVQQCIVFDIRKTEKTDAVMSLLWTEVADFYKTTLVQKEHKKLDITDFFRR